MVKNNDLVFKNGRLYYKSKELDEMMRKKYNKKNRSYKVILLTRFDVYQLMIMTGSNLTRLIRAVVKSFLRNVSLDWKLTHNEIYWHTVYEWRKKIKLRRKRFIVYEDTKQSN
jgi:hypothetical protein